MQQPITTIYPISDILEWEVSTALVIASKFQRRDVWSSNAKSYLIDTILRSMPIPPIYIRLKLDPSKKQTIREVVDGQQRLRAVLGFVRGDFPVNENHNKDYANYYYDDLPDEARRKFLSYKFIINLLENINDADVLAIFARINSYTLTLNPQEKRNADYFGIFKQTVYQLSLQHYSFWLNNGILTDNQIARMKEAELVSILIMTLMDGIRQTKPKDIDDFYKEYDENFPQQDKVVKQFENVIDTIGNIFQDTLSKTRFTRIPLFYSLFCLIYDLKFGLPKSGNTKRLKFTNAENQRIADSLYKIDNVLRMKRPPRVYREFVDASRRRTADIGTRKLRHEFLLKIILDANTTT